MLELSAAGRRVLEQTELCASFALETIALDDLNASNDE